MGPTGWLLQRKLFKKKKRETRRHCAIKEVMTWACSINTHRHIHAVGVGKPAPGALREIWKFSMEEMGSPGVFHHTV